MSHLCILALGASLIALLIRRRSWGIKFETANTAAIVLQAAAVLILSPWLDDRIGRLMHALTGMWNIEDFIAHTLYIGSVAALLSMCFGRLDITVRQFQELVIQRIVTPMTLFVPILLAAFTFGHLGKRDVPDLWLHDPDKMSLGHRAYWTIFFWGAAFLLLQIAYVLWKIRYGQARIAALYLVAAVATMAGLILFLINPLCELVAWFLIRVALVLFSVAAIWSWRRRQPETAPIPRERLP